MARHFLHDGVYPVPTRDSKFATPFHEMIETRRIPERADCEMILAAGQIIRETQRISRHDNFFESENQIARVPSEVFRQETEARLEAILLARCSCLEFRSFQQHRLEVVQ